MSLRSVAFALVLSAVACGGCDYVVLPPDDGGAASGSDKGWTAVATAVGPTGAGDLAVALTIRNETGNWSAMQAVPNRPAVLTNAGGTAADCATVLVGTGGHRLAPGLQMRGYVSGPSTKPATEAIRVECKGMAAGPGSKLAIDYSYVTGEYNYYEPDANQVFARLEVDLDAVSSDLSYPVAERIDGVIVPPDTEFTAINDVILTLLGVERSGPSLRSTWRATNPGEYQTYVHIGNPPVIGADGVLYGIYESPDIATVPVTPAGGEVEWTTEVAVPSDITGLTMLLSVESKKQRLFVNYAIDLSED